MGLTTHIKTSSVNVTTEDTERAYYTDEEWQLALSAKAIQAVVNARTRRTVELKGEADAEVAEVILPWQILEAQMRGMELLELLIDGPLTGGQQAELDLIKAKRADAKAIRIREVQALQAVLDALDIAAIDAVTL